MDTRKPILAAGGARGIVRLFSPASMTCVRNFVGHGNAINEVRAVKTLEQIQIMIVF